jgi:DnaK suppressor protein
MTPEKQETFRPLIEERIAEAKAEIAKSAEDTKPISPDVSIGRLSRLDSMQMQQMALDAKRRQQMLLVRLEEALKRLNQGTYGQCLQCRQKIAEERLRYQPDAVLCMKCAR